MEALNITSFSTSDLIKKSAKCICYFRNKNKQYVVTDNQIKGNEYAISKTSGFIEMRGTFKKDNLILYYVFDEIRLKENIISFIEHKWVKDYSLIEDWFLNMSILQMALYCSLHQINNNKEYNTASFFVKQDNNINKILINDNSKKEEYILYFGEKIINIDILNPNKIVDLYIEKAKASLDYETAIEFDFKYKFKEWENLNKYLTYTILN
jgi:hypothetical protein